MRSSVVAVATEALYGLTGHGYDLRVVAEIEIVRNINSMVRRIQPLQYVLDRLERGSIRYGLYAGSHVSIIAGNRVSADVDFLVHDDDMPALRDLFPFARTADRGHGLALYVGDRDLIEFMGQADILRNGSRYPFRLTELAIARLATYRTSLAVINIVDPVDTLILKALLQRGHDQGKHDAEDLAALAARSEVDEGYLNARLDETGAREATRATWRRLGVLV